MNKPAFVALDGEAIENKYCLLGTSITGKTLENKKGIKTDEALSWLCSLGSNRHFRSRSSVFVSFFFSYDVEMLIRDLPETRKIILFKTGKVNYKNWRLSYYKRKFFSVKRIAPEKLKDGSGQNRSGTNGITIFDVCGFFIGQGGFIKVLQSFGIDVPKEITKGKAGRSAFTWTEYETIKRYNFLECELLVELMNKVYDLCERIDLVPRRWYGSSALANLALRKWSVSDYSRRTSAEYTPPPFFDAITRAYFGGRIEAFKLGTFRNTYAYDINSAYPSAMVHLPKTKGKFWLQTDKYIRKAFAVYHVKFRFPENEHIGYLPYRKKDGSIKFPLRGEGWYWQPEIELAKKVYPQSIEIIDGYYLAEAKEKTPLAERIPILYKQRQRYKSDGDLSQWIIKIVLNSLYGKFAQKVGKADFKNFVYAGFITSYTRAKMRAACVGAEDSIVAFNTDGIFSTKKLSRISKNSKELGEWECKRHKKLTVIMSGLYLIEKENGTTEARNRGFAGMPEWTTVFDSLNRKRCNVKGCNGGKHVHVDINTFVGFLLSFNFPDAFGGSYLKFLHREKIINPASPTKRKYLLNEIKNWRTDSCESRPIKRLDGCSYPIKLAVELNEEDLYEILEG